MRIFNLLCFIPYNLGYFDHVGNRIVVSSSVIIYSRDLLAFASWWSFKLLSRCNLCKKMNFSDTPVPSLFHIPNGFTVKHRRSVRISCQCDTNWARHFTLDAHASSLLSYVIADIAAIINRYLTHGYVRNRYRRQGYVIASHRTLWGAITYPCLRWLLLTPKPSILKVPILVFRL